MKTSAVICEFNPLHHGHLHILSEMRRDSDCVIAIMSGNFVQRSTPAVLDKYMRAQMAISAGADLVVELPFPWCAASAEYFAKAGAAIAENLLAQTLAFGVGTSDPSRLFQAAEVFLDPGFQEEIRLQNTESDISRGIASVREICLKSKYGDKFSEILRTPNDILAIEYLMQIRKNGYRISPRMVDRLTTEGCPEFLSASRIREIIRAQSVKEIKANVPEFVYRLLEEALSSGTYANEDVLTEVAFRALRTDLTPFDSPVADGEGGLFRRIYNAANEAKNPAEMLVQAATKKYTNARIRRVLLYYLLKITPDILRETPHVTTVLAANPTGCAYLSSIRKSTSLSLLTKPATFRNLPPDLMSQYIHTHNADRLYTLLIPCGREADYYLKQSPWIVK